MVVTIPVQTIQDFYCDAAARGYAGGGEYRSTGVPGEKGFVWSEKILEGRVSLCFRNVYVSFGPESGGHTYIHARDNSEHGNGWLPVWLMQFRGAEFLGWEERARNLLKRALLHCYRNRIFSGGRGPLRFQEEDGADKGSDHYFSYWNDYKGDFTKSSGTEMIRMGPFRDNRSVFYHDYNSLLIAPCKTVPYAKLVVEI